MSFLINQKNSLVNHKTLNNFVIKLRFNGALENNSANNGSINTIKTNGNLFDISPKILLVEDNPLLQTINKKLLVSLGCQVDIAKNGFEAIALFKQSYDLIFMDVGLPDILGTYVATEIRQYEKDHEMKNRVPIIALTAMADAEECIEAGMNEIATKPVLIEGLYKILVRYLITDKQG